MTFGDSGDAVVARLIEEAAEELGRLDSLVAMAPGAVPTVLQASLVARLATSEAEAMRSACVALVAARVEMVHAAALDASVEQWQARVDDGERRARSGVPLAPPEALSLTTAQRADLLAALRPGGTPRPVLLRAVHTAATLEAAGHSVAESELAAALVLTASGVTDRLRLLPFGEFAPAARAEAVSAWTAGDTDAYTRCALGALAPAARRLRVQVRLLLESQSAEDAHLASIGRASILARRALDVLRASLATSVPALSASLDCSRPAAGEALERLVALGLAEEITGRARDRVFAYAGAWGLL
jgi:hypothetical protein